MKQPRKRRQISPSRASVLPSAACVFPGPFLLRHPRLHSGGRRRHLGSSACFASLRRLVAFVAVSGHDDDAGEARSSSDPSWSMASACRQVGWWASPIRPKPGGSVRSKATPIDDRLLPCYYSLLLACLVHIHALNNSHTYHKLNIPINLSHFIASNLYCHPHFCVCYNLSNLSYDKVCPTTKHTLPTTLPIKYNYL